MECTFTLQDTNERSYRFFTWFLFFMHLVALAVVALYTVQPPVKQKMYILTGFYILVAAVYMFYRRKKKALETFALIMAALYANFWLRHVHVVAAIVFVGLFLFVQYVYSQKTTVKISKQGAAISRIFKTALYPWYQIDNLVLKDNLLTIDLKSNKMIQAGIVQDLATVTEAEFNSFCREHLQHEPVT